MIKTFPDYSNLDLVHRDIILKFTSLFEPYSDFNFLSLYAWDINQTTAISTLNGNLIIVFPYYLTGKPIMSVLGSKNMKDTLTTLLKYSPVLKLVPKVVKDSLNNSSGLNFLSDVDNFDYLYELKDHAEMSGGKFKGLRKALHKFEGLYGNKASVTPLDLGEKEKIDELVDVFNQWSAERGKVENEVENERKAILRVLKSNSHFNLDCYEILIDGVVAGFSINEIMPNNYATCHFQKCLLNYEGIDVFLTNFVAKELIRKGCAYINWEQDLGIEGLRTLKQGYRPIKMLEKYTVATG